jgi:hypothetical protein
MNRPVVLIVSGVAGLIVLALAFRQCGRSDSGGLAATREPAEQVSRLANMERPGWVARSDTEGSGDGSQSSESGGRRAEGAGGAVRGGQGSEPADAGGRQGAATVVQRRQSRGAVTAGSGRNYASSDAIEVPGAVAVQPAPFEGALSPSGGRRQGTEQRVVESAGGTDKSTEGDNNGVLLEVSFDKTTQPEKGDVSPTVEQGVTLDEHGAKFSADAQFVIPNAGNIKGEAGTISFSLEPDWAGSDPSIRSLLQLRGANSFENRLQIFKDGPFMRFLFTPDSGLESGVSYAISSWQPGEQHQITTTWGVSPSGEPLAALYIDGQLIRQQTYDGELVVQPGTPLYIGSDYQGGAPGAEGSISSLKVFDHPLSSDEIAAQASGQDTGQSN